MRFLKYALLVLVLLLPVLIENSLGLGEPYFCKYICPQGVLQGALPLAAANSGIRAALGPLFSWKFAILLAVIVLSVFFYRPFCKWLCSLGAFYSLFNKISLVRMGVDHGRCISCDACSKACGMDVDVVSHPDHPECIRCGKCVGACPVQAVSYTFCSRGKGAACPTASMLDSLETIARDEKSLRGNE
ncbi:MAG: 4Fe-4S binding protein [Eggerthellaceae bacterium]